MNPFIEVKSARVCFADLKMCECTAQLWMHTSRALSVETIRRTRIDALRHELDTLERKLADDAASTQRHLEQLATAECLALTTKVMTQLPREIRDMIYRQLSTRPNERIESAHFHATLDPLTRLYSYDHARWKASHFPEHYWNAAYVGSDFFHELMENYYRTSTFVFSDDADAMARFLTTNEFRLPVLPKDLVSQVEIHLNAVSYDRGSFRAYLYGVPKTAQRLQEQLQPVFELKGGARIGIHFLTDAKEKKEREERCEAGLETLFSEAQRAQLKRYRVRFVVDETHVFNLEAERTGAVPG